jgi:DNA-binding XRE family transcriptional regulator
MGCGGADERHKSFLAPAHVLSPVSVRPWSIAGAGATKEPMQCAVRNALIAFMAATAQAQAEATKEAQRAGITHTRAGITHKPMVKRAPTGAESPSYGRRQFESAQAMLGNSASVGEVANSIGLTRQTIYRIKDDPVGPRCHGCHRVGHQQVALAGGPKRRGVPSSRSPPAASPLLLNEHGLPARASVGRLRDVDPPAAWSPRGLVAEHQ